MTKAPFAYFAYAVKLVGIEDVASLELLIAFDHSYNYRANIYQRKIIKTAGRLVWIGVGEDRSNKEREMGYVE